MRGQIGIINLKKSGERERRKEIWIIKLKKGGEREMTGEENRTVKGTVQFCQEMEGFEVKLIG
jgi:hypothetical protein